MFVPNSPKDYRPPTSRTELEKRYAAGERCFPGTELSDVDLSGAVLDSADFEKHSWFADTNFSGVSLRGTSFRECNVKCANFSNADLTGANFELAAIESIKATGATRNGVNVRQQEEPSGVLILHQPNAGARIGDNARPI